MAAKRRRAVPSASDGKGELHFAGKSGGLYVSGSSEELVENTKAVQRRKTVNRSSGSALGGRTRAVTGTCGEKPELMYEYVVYVKKEDYEEAASLIRK